MSQGFDTGSGQQAVSLGRLVQQHQGAVRGFLRRLCRDRPDLADDLAQDTFIKAWERLEQVDPTRNPRAWLCGIAYRLYLDQKKSWLRRLLREGLFWQSSQHVQDLSEQAGARLDLDRAMKGLSLEQKAVISLCLLGDFSHSEAAEALSLPLGTVKSHLNRGRQVLLNQLDSGLA